MKNIDKFYKVSNGRLVFPGLDRSQLTKGETYNLKGSLLTDGMYGETHQVYFFEYSKPGELACIMTGRRGEKSFAVATNDCARDGFPTHCLAKVLVEPGNHIMYAVPEVDDTGKFTGKHTITTFEVVEILPALGAAAELSINVKYVNKSVVAGDHDVKTYKEAVKHLLFVSRRKTDDYTTPKYCFNPGRVVSNRLFSRDKDGGELVSFNDSGKKLILNRNSLEGLLYKSKGVYADADNLFMRCFYSKKHAHESIIFIDGARLTMLETADLQDYIEKSNLTKDLAESIIKRAVTTHGNTFYVVVNVKDEIRPIYINSYGYATFPLLESERDFIERLDDITL